MASATKTTQVTVVAYIPDKSSIVCKWNDADVINVRVTGEKPAIDSVITVSYKLAKESGCPKFASYHHVNTEMAVVKPAEENKNKKAKVEKPVEEKQVAEFKPVDAATVEEWEAEGGIILNPGESVFVKGTKDTYKVTRGKADGVYCSCAAWKFQRLNPLRRTCKHCEAVCGKEAEALRIAMNTVKLLNAPKKEEKPAAPAVPTPSNTRRPSRVTNSQ
jgi:hypothetical protein